MGAAGSKQLTFSTIFNVRDLGGYATPNGSTHYRRFLRTGDTMFLSDEDRNFLLDYGVARVVDLRMAVERPDLSNRLAHLDGVAWMNLSMADDRTMTPEWMKSGTVVSFVVEGYQRMLADHEGVRALVEFMAQAKPGEVVLFHCAGGMDRTGVVSMLVLGAAGVSNRDIMADYAYSFGEEAEVDDLLATWTPEDAPAQHDGLLCRVQAMYQLLEWVDAEYGDVRGLLSSCGVSAQHIDALAQHLVGEW